MLGAVFAGMFRAAAASYEALAAAGGWLLGPIGSRPPSKREEVNVLMRAREDIQRQIEILSLGPVNVWDQTPQTARSLEELRLALGEIDAAIERLPPS